MKKLLSIVFFFFSVTAFSQMNSGIYFRTASDWEAVLKMARKEDKLIFVDCYSYKNLQYSQMEAHVFNDYAISNLVNSKFVNIRLSADSTVKGDKVSVYWAALFEKWRKTFGVKELPGFLFFNSKGQVLHKGEGILDNLSFLSLVNNALDDRRQFYTLKRRVEEGDTARAVVMKLVEEAYALKDKPLCEKLGGKFLQMEFHPFTVQHLNIVIFCLNNPRDAAFDFLYRNRNKVDSVLNNGGSIVGTLVNVANAEAFKMYIANRGGNIRWDSISLLLQQFIPQYETRARLSLKYSLDYNSGKWEDYAVDLLDYFDSCFSQFTHNDKSVMNNQLYELFQHCFVQKTLSRAADWSRKTLYMDGLSMDPELMDTYANLLYKSGQIALGKQYEKEAIGIATDRNEKEDADSFTETLNKMNAKLPTWPTRDL